MHHPQHPMRGMMASAPLSAALSAPLGVPVRSTGVNSYGNLVNSGTVSVGPSTARPAKSEENLVSELYQVIAQKDKQVAELSAKLQEQTVYAAKHEAELLLLRRSTETSFSGLPRSASPHARSARSSATMARPASARSPSPRTMSPRPG